MNAEINTLRQEIEQLDRSLIETISKRFEVCKKIGENKKTNGLPIEDPKREKEIIENKIKTSTLNPEFTRNLFEIIFKESKKIQNEP